MSEPFLGQIKPLAFDFAPRGWAQCNGQLLPINQNQALFSLLGTQYGGNGTTNFALPDLRGRVPMLGSSSLGESAGAESVTLTTGNLPVHTHALNATTAVANKRVPTGKLLAADNATIAEYYAAPTGGLTPLSTSSMSSVGGNQAHTNVQPYTTLNFCIALQGIFPSRN